MVQGPRSHLRVYGRLGMSSDSGTSSPGAFPGHRQTIRTERLCQGGGMTETLRGQHRRGIGTGRATSIVWAPPRRRRRGRR